MKSILSSGFNEPLIRNARVQGAGGICHASVSAVWEVVVSLRRATRTVQRATPESVSVIPTPNSHAAVERSCPPSLTPAHRPEASPRALSAERSEPELSWPIRWDTYSSGLDS